IIAEAVEDATYRLETAFMAAAWLLETLEWRLGDALKDDRTWGIASVRGRLLWYLEATIGMAEAADVLPGFRLTAHAWLTELRVRWPSTSTLAFYPAFAMHTA